MMRVSRRVFLGAACALPAVGRCEEPRPRCRVVDLGCVLRESLAGFEGQIGDLPHDVVIVPGIGSLNKDGDRAIRGFLARGATVLLEYAGGAQGSRDDYFPYVEYFWPVRVKIREFAPVRLEPAPDEEIIATFREQPVGLRRKVGPGTLITLGSPLGPVFLTGDPDAQRWLDSLLAQAEYAPRGI
jgi:hypothetical protein